MILATDLILDSVGKYVILSNAIEFMYCPFSYFKPKKEEKIDFEDYFLQDLGLVLRLGEYGILIEDIECPEEYKENILPIWFKERVQLEVSKK